jgi:aryl-alcohol dehydrogenase-like predicted oxidoreductase
VAIFGTREPAHIDDAVRAADLTLDEEALSLIDTVIAGVVTVVGPSPASTPSLSGW